MGGKFRTKKKDEALKQEAEDTEQAEREGAEKNNWESGVELMLAGRERGKMWTFFFYSNHCLYQIVMS